MTPPRNTFPGGPTSPVVLLRTFGDHPHGARLDLPTGQASSLITAGIARPADQTTATPSSTTPQPPPRTGRGSGKQAWAEYATAVGVHVDADDSRDDIIDKIDNGGPHLPPTTHSDADDHAQ
jgi:hypothetical protein